MRVRFETLGCRLNQAESDAWARGFSQCGQVIDDDQGTVDLVVVNTCAVTGEAVRKSRQLLRRMRRRYPDARLVVTGCVASLGDSAALSRDGADLLLPNADKERLVTLACRDLPPCDDTEVSAPCRAARVFVKVQDGCRHRCTFCVTALARGAERSRPIPEILAEIRALVAEGAREAVLTGVHLAGYGHGIGEDLAGLLTTILAETDLERLRLGSVEPWGLSERFWWLFDNPRLMPHLHLPVQSGADRLLRRMARRCDTAAFARLAARARAAHPEFNLTTDILVGFPGETDVEWRQTLAFVDSIGFGGVHAFPYSPRPGTLAARFTDQVDAPIKRARMGELQQLAARLRRDFLTRQIDQVLPVLIEACAGDMAFGYTANYLPVRVARDANVTAVGDTLAVRIATLVEDGGSLIGIAS